MKVIDEYGWQGPSKQKANSLSAVLKMEKIEPRYITTVYMNISIAPGVKSEDTDR